MRPPDERETHAPACSPETETRKHVLTDAELRELLLRGDAPPNLVVFQLDLSNETTLTCLPEGLHVDFMLSLEGCTALKTLPEGLSVGFALRLEGCTALTAFPRTWKAECVSLSGGVHLETMFGSLTIPCSLRLSGPSPSLPDGLLVDGDLSLDDHTTLPERLEVNGNLDLDRCPRLTSLPRRWKARSITPPRGVSVDALVGSPHLPCGLSMYLSQIVSLPEGLRVEGDLDLECCKALTSLPENLYVGGNLDLSWCTALTSLPRGLEVRGNIKLDGCSALRCLPDDLHAEHDLDLGWRTAPILLPDGFEVGGDLALHETPTLTAAQLPRGLKVGGNLHVGGCPALISLPEGLVVEGDIFTEGSGLPPGKRIPGVRGKRIG